jgi:hypothetical protein
MQVCVLVHMAQYEHRNKSQLTVTNMATLHTFSSPNDLKKPYNMTAGPRITVSDPKYNT